MRKFYTTLCGTRSLACALWGDSTYKNRPIPFNRRPQVCVRVRVSVWRISLCDEVINIKSKYLHTNKHIMVVVGGSRNLRRI